MVNIKEKKKPIVIIASAIVTILVVGCIAIIYLAQRPSQGPGGPEEGEPENIQDMIINTIVTEKGAIKENVKICFYEQTIDNDVYAAGVVIRGGGTLVFFYNKTSCQITQTENEHTPTTNEEFQALSAVVGTISPWTGNEIVPCNFTKTDNTYSFKYYDDYFSPLSRWSYGWATLYLDNDAIEWGAHTL